MSQLAASKPEPLLQTEAGIRQVVTSQVFDAPVARVWSCLRYYEQVELPPPLLLRVLLPTPVRTVGRKTEVGDEALCEYRGGYLRKRVTEVVAERLYRFEVVEQDLPLHGAKLRGGSYTLASLPDGRTRLALETRYEAVPRRVGGFVRAAVEKQVCHAFHRHILSAMRSVMEDGALG